MLMKLVRTIVALITGLAVALGLVIAAEGFSEVFHPFPPGVDSSDMEVCRAHVARYPAWILAVIVPWWSATAFVSVWPRRC